MLSSGEGPAGTIGISSGVPLLDLGSSFPSVMEIIRMKTMRGGYKLLTLIMNDTEDHLNILE